MPDSAARDDTLIAERDVVQRVVGLGRAARNSSGVRVRQPLSRLLVRIPVLIRTAADPKVDTSGMPATGSGVRPVQARSDMSEG